MNIPLYAVIPSCCRRQELTNLVNTLVNDGVHVIVVDTGYEKALNFGGAWQTRISILRSPVLDKNISTWWNMGLNLAEFLAYDHGMYDYTVAVLNDDIVIKSGFVRRLSDAIFQHDAAAAAPDVWGWQRDRLYTEPAGSPMPGFAFALRGSKQLRADESLKWWYGDNDLSWQAMQAGGLVTVAKLPLQHLYPNSTTVGALAEQAGRDRETFIAKWGRAPW